MGDCDWEVHFLGATQLTGMTGIDVSLDVVLNIWPIVADSGLLGYSPYTMVSISFVHFPKDSSSSFPVEDNYLRGGSILSAVHVNSL